MSALNNSALMGASGATGYQISRSVRLRSSASAYFNRTPASSSGQQTFTLSDWVKRGSLSSEQVLFGINSGGTNIFTIAFLSGNTLRVFGRNAGVDVLNLTTTAVYRDPSAWYHIVVAIDTTQATAANRARLYVNGVEVTAFSTATYPAQNTSLAWNSSSYAHDIGRESTGNYFDGYRTEINHISGSQLTPASFGETDAVTGVWKPKKYTGTYGTNGFYLNFSDNSSNTATTIGKDYSGNGNNWTPNNISVTAGATYDSMLDVPTQWADGGNGRGNYAVLNPLTTTAGTYSNANLRYVGASAWRRSNGSISVTSGKWYWEVTLGNAPFSPRGSTTSYNAFGFGLASVFNSTTQSSSATDGVYLADNSYYKNFSGAWTDGGVAFSSGDVLAVAVDLGANTFTFYRNNTQVVTGTIGVTAGTELAPIILSYDGTYGVMDCNFGQRPFAYTPPSGFKALNTLNLPTPTILKGNQYFDATTYTGNGGTQSIVNAGGFQPDLVWVKARSVAYNNYLTDSVRGAGKELSSNLTDAESSFNLVSAFNSNGFTVFTNGTYLASNQNGTTYVGWQWKEGATQGFDIVTYTGTGVNRTVAHNLGVAPAMMIVKRRDGSTHNWRVYHRNAAASPATGTLYLSLTNAFTVDSTEWNNTAPTSSVFTVGTQSSVNGSGGTFVAYLFAEVAGFSAFGSYTGNGSADGPFVFLGFRPKFVMWKNASSAQSWLIEDAVRSPYNQVGLELYPNLSSAEDSGSARSPTQHFDFLSNGFKVRGAQEQSNQNGNTIIYAAFAENPFKNALAR